jgi:hypothetical protein
MTAVADVRVFARPSGEDAEGHVTNQDVRIDGSVAIISYDLEGQQGATYAVAVELRRESDRDFVLIPVNLTGDAGDVQANGMRKVIRWEYLKTFPNGLAGDDFYFKITVTRSGGFPWLWVAIGSAAVAGAVVVFEKKSTSTPAQPGTVELPLPPGRLQ